MPRALLPDFALANPRYAGWAVTVYEVNANFQQTTTLVSVFQNPTGAAVRSNPLTLDSDGKFPGPCYVDKPVSLVASNGIISTQLGTQGAFGRWRGVWAAGTLYYAGERLRHPSEPSTYIVAEGHTSSNFATDLAGRLLEAEIDALSMAEAAGQTILGTTIPVSPVLGFLRVNAAGNGLEALAPSAARNALSAPASVDVLHADGSVPMTGSVPLTLNVDPVSALDAATKQYVDARISRIITTISAAVSEVLVDLPAGWVACRVEVFGFKPATVDALVLQTRRSGSGSFDTSYAHNLIGRLSTTSSGAVLSASSTPSSMPLTATVIAGNPSGNSFGVLFLGGAAALGTLVVTSIGYDTTGLDTVFTFSSRSTVAGAVDKLRLFCLGGANLAGGTIVLTKIG